MKKYLLCAVAIMFLASCNQDDLQRLRTENQELKNRLAALEQENTKLKEAALTAQSPVGQITGESASQESGTQKLAICQREAEKKFVGETSIINDWQGRPVETVQESIKLKCDYGDIYTSGRVFNKYNGSRESLNWSQNR